MRLFEVAETKLQPFDAETPVTPNEIDMEKDPEYMAKKGMVGGVEWMSPSDYIERCVQGFKSIGEPGEVERGRNPTLVKQYAQEMQAGDKFPRLSLDYRGGFGQEGLHRAMAAKTLGVESVPVFVTKESPEYTTKRDAERRAEMDRIKQQYTPSQRDYDVVDDILGSFNEAIKIGGEKNAGVDEFMEKYYKVTQNHPFDPEARIAWDGKSTVTIVPFKDHIHLSAVQTLAPGERSGSANGVVMTLVALADETGVPLRLNAKPFGEMEGKLTKPQLKAWYKRRGFVIDRGDEMVYTPEEKLDEYKEIVHDTEEGDGNIFGYVVDTDEVQLVNYFVDNHGVSENIISAIQAKYDTVAIARGMHVDDEYRNQGYGTELMNEFIEEAASEGAQAVLAIADALEDNEFDLVKWYESWGFEVISQTGQGPFMVMEL